MKAIDNINKHLNDVKIMLNVDNKAIDIMNRDLDFVKWLINECNNDLNKEIDVDEMWNKFLNKDKVL
jgi:hypothetical protein